MWIKRVFVRQLKMPKGPLCIREGCIIFVQLEEKQWTKTLYVMISEIRTGQNYDFIWTQSHRTKCDLLISLGERYFLKNLFSYVNSVGLTCCYECVFTGIFSTRWVGVKFLFTFPSIKWTLLAREPVQVATALNWPSACRTSRQGLNACVWPTSSQEGQQQLT